MLIIFVIFIYIIIGTMTSNFMYYKWKAEEKLRWDSSADSVACGVFWPVTLTIVFGNWLYKKIFKPK